VSLALPPSPSPARPRTMLVATSLGVVGGFMLLAGLLAIYLNLRDAGGGTTATWIPAGVTVPEVATNIMLITMIGAAVVVHWAHYAIGQDNRRDTLAALFLLIVLGIAVINAQVYVYQQMGFPPIAESGYTMLVYAITGTFVAALVLALIYTLVVVFRSMGGRYSSSHHEGITSLALYWDFLAVAFTAIWYVIYVTK
jgi:cytochrome c oxidase subunit 3